MRGLSRAIALAGALLLSAAPAASAFFETQYQWRINRVSNPYQTAGPWNICGEAEGGSTGATVGCSRAFSVANTVSGTLGVSDGILSATLGYSVTATTTVTPSGSFPVPRHRLGVAEWRAEYQTRAVHQRLYKRVWVCGRGGCVPESWQATNHYTTAYANRYAYPRFRAVIH